MSPLVSINLCCYNSERFLEATLASLFAQTFRDWELVVVDDGSRDATAAILQRHIAAGQPIRCHSQANAGLGRARNQAIALSRGRWIALIDHDDLWRPEKLARQLALAEAQPELGLIYTGALTLYPDGRTEPYADQAVYQGDVLAPLFCQDFAVCSTLLLRRDALEAVGVFDPELRQAEEWDLMLRLAARYPFGCAPEPLVSVRLHAGNASRDNARLQREEMEVARRALARTPELRRQLGPALVRVKLAGLGLRPDEARALRGAWAAVGWAARGRALGKLLLAGLPAEAVIRLRSAWRAGRRRLQLRGEHANA